MQIPSLVTLAVAVVAVTSVAMTSLVTSARVAKKAPCEQTGRCSCRNEKGTLDLSPLADNFTARYKDVPDTQGAAMYSWNPCLTFTEDQCVDVAACQLLGDANKTSNAIGTQDSAQFVTNERGDLTLQYTYPDPSGVNRTTIVTLVCKPNSESLIAVTGEMVAFHYSITLMSPFACFRP